MKEATVTTRVDSTNEQQTSVDHDTLDLSVYDQGANGAWSGLPLRVQVYEQVNAWIHTGQLAPGSQLPTENGLCDLFGVSRTVIREALILLEEDGVVVRRRGIGRFVATDRPELGLEQLRPLERLLGTDGVVRLETSIEKPTSLVEHHLAVGPDSNILRWETLLSTEEGPACLSEEWMAWPSNVAGAAGRLLAATVEAETSTTASMAALVWDCCGPTIGPGVCRITVTSAEARRAELLGVDEGSPLLAIVQVINHLGQPLLCLKHLLRTDRAPLMVQQRRGGGPDA